MLIASSSLPAHAQNSAGYSEYYIPGSEQQLWDIFVNLDNDPVLVSGSGMHAVIAVTASLDGTTVYYDHWEDGYDFDPNTPGTADETYTINAGEVQEFESSNIPVNPRGTSVFYDGTDRIYVAGGPVTVTRASWPESIGTVFALAWEIYPTKPFLTDYTIPVGQDLAGAPRNYDDFARAYVIVQSTSDGNAVQIDDPTTVGVDVSVTLNMGEVTQLYSINTGTTVSASSPVQVQIIVGQAQSGGPSEARGFSAVPDSLWDTEYYNPVSSSGDSDGAVDLYLYNPNASAITVNFADTSGSGSFSIPASSTRSYSEGAGRLVPTGSGVHLSSSSVFWGIGSGGTESANYDWGFSLVPGFALQDHYYLGWAPGTSQATPTSNGSPVYITPVQDDTEVFIDYSPTDGTPDVSFTLDRLQSQKVFDPDNENTGMHIYATGDIAVAWGEDSSASSVGTPYLDLGYTTLPLPADWMDVVLEIDKSADPTSLPLAIGQISTFTLEIQTSDFPVDDVDVFDSLPPGWAYVDDSTVITLPGGSSISGNAADPTTIATPDLTWDINVDMAINQTLTVVFDAETTGSAVSGLNQNDGSASGTRLGGAQVFTPVDSAFVFLSPTGLTIDKDTSTSTAEAGGTATYTIVLANGGSTGVTDLTIADSLPTDFTFASALITETSAIRTSTTNPSVGDSSLNWGTWDIAAGGSVSINFVVNIDASAALGTYDNTASADSNESGVIDDAGTTAQDPDTPSGEDPEDDEDVTLGDVLPTATVTKTAVPTSVDEPGGNVTFTVVVANSSTAEALTLSVLDDDIYNDITTSGHDGIVSTTCAVPQTIAIGGNYSCSFVAAVSGNAGDSQTDTVTATVSDDDGNSITPSDDATVSITNVASSIAVSKTADPTGVPAPGASVTFSVQIDNTSTTDPVTITNLSDDVHGNLDGQGTCSVPQTIAVSGSYNCSFTTTVSGSAGASETDTVTASGTDDDGDSVSDDDDATVYVVGFTKSLDDTNQSFTSDPDVAIGEILTYEIVLQVAPGTATGMTLDDVLDRGLAFVGCESITPSSGSLTTTETSFASVCSSPTVSAEPSGSAAAADQGRRVSFDFGDVDNPTGSVQSLTVRYTTVVLDNADNLRGVTLGNDADWDWDAGSAAASAADVTVVEPALSLTKIASPTTGIPGTTITFTLTLAHTGASDSNAYDLELTDTIPTGLTYVSGSLAHTGGLAPSALDDGSAPSLSVSWDNFPLGNSSVIGYQATLGPLPAGSSVSNDAFLEWSSLPGDVSSPQSSHNSLSTERSYDPGDPVDVYGLGTSATVSVTGGLPATGFPPGRVTALPAQSVEYASTGVQLEISRLRVRSQIVGVPLLGSGWDLSWLWDRIGFLEGTAFPTWSGNTALTAHSVLSDGLPGPFARIEQLAWGDEIVLHAFGLQYVYQVRQVREVAPGDLSVLRHESTDWLTLISCSDYALLSGLYLKRVVVRAVLMGIH